MANCAEKALLSAILESGHGEEIVKGYVRDSLLEEHQEEELAFRAEVEERMHENKIDLFTQRLFSPELQ